MQDKQNETLEEKSNSSTKEASTEQKKMKTASNKKSPASKKNPSTAAKKKTPTASGANTAAKKRKATKENPPKEKSALTKPIEDNSTVSESESSGFDSLKDSIDGFSELELNLSEEEMSQAKRDAIDSLPHVPSIDSLLFDATEEFDARETPEESSSYENFLSDYRKAMGAVLKRLDTSADEAEAEKSESEASNYSEIDAPKDKEPYVEALSEPTPSEELPTSEDGLEKVLDQTEQLVIDFGEIPDSDEQSESEEEPALPHREQRQPKKYEEKYNPEKPRRIDGIFELVELFVFTLVAVLIVTTFFFRHSVVDGGSMKNTLQHGDHLIITDFLYTPKRGDIIVFEDHAVGATSPYIKRVIGVAGDTVRIEENGSVYVNEVKLNESYVYRPGDYSSLTVKVGEGELFVLGDHRSDSRDSREFGVINEESVLGKVILRIYPFSKFGTVK